MSETPERKDYSYFLALPTRWRDNDLYGHINNVVYYEYFDTVANHFLIHEGGLDIQGGDVIGYIVNSSCNYLKGAAFPAELSGGFRVNRLGNSSVEYGIGVFQDETLLAHGTFTHVFVNRDDERPTPIPDGIRNALQKQLR
jgi:acyl-CoA thioester hydrolase